MSAYKGRRPSRNSPVLGAGLDALVSPVDHQVVGMSRKGMHDTAKNAIEELTGSRADNGDVLIVSGFLSGIC
jgi:hypothetical protein